MPCAASSSSDDLRLVLRERPGHRGEAGLELAVLVLRGQRLRPVQGQVEGGPPVVDLVHLAGGQPVVLEVVADGLVEGLRRARFAFALPVVLRHQLERRHQRAVLAERVPAQVAFLRRTAARAWAPSRRPRSRTARRRSCSGTIDSIRALVPSSRIGNRSVR